MLALQAVTENEESLARFVMGDLKLNPLAALERDWDDVSAGQIVKFRDVRPRCRPTDL